MTDHLIAPPALMRRRGLLQAAGLFAAAPWASLALAGSADAERNRFVFFILRGGMDGLFTVPPVGDPSFAASRGSLANYETAPLPLQAQFALHPALPELHGMFKRGEMSVVHAVGLPYHERSHFDAQQVLESGGTQPFQLRDGWLGRALAAGGQKGLALSTSVPLVLRGARAVDTWAPSDLPDPSSDLLQRLERMYMNDAVLLGALTRARDLRGAGDVSDERMGGGKRNLVAQLATKAGEFLALPTGPQVAVLEMSGWDSHAAQDSAKGRMPDTLRQLDAALAALRTALTAPGAGSAWRRTVVVVATEFGRTVEVNGTHGTDHGNGSAAFVLGGAVRGGQVLSDWPGLAPANRYLGRDLMITTDLRAVLKGALADHLQIASAALNQQVFPDSAAVRPLQLLRS
jgi:uncharacterized protein (DUF1501 family)